MSSTTPTPRRFLARPRPSFGHSNVGTASTPNLSASYHSQQPPSSLPHQTLRNSKNNNSTDDDKSSSNSITNNRKNLSQHRSNPLSPSTLLARKASLNALTSGSLATVPDATKAYALSTVRDEDSPPHGTGAMAPSTPTARRMNGDSDIEVGDTVDVPGGMHGTVKFVGTVKGKSGTFAGVELSREYATRGKNDGDVDG
jgi:hypothetical protein